MHAGPNGELTIRDLARAELDALLSLYAQLHPHDEQLPARDVIDQMWESIFSDPCQIYLGGFVDGQLVSACNAAVIPNLTRGARPYALIENVVTDARFRRRGIGSRVVQQLVQRCWDRQCYKVMLMSAVGRSEIHGFYESLGFDKNAKQAFVATAR